MTQTLFDAGRRRATSEAVLANYDALVASYRQTTLTAFQQVEDTLAALRVLAQETDQQQTPSPQRRNLWSWPRIATQAGWTRTCKSSPLKPWRWPTNGTPSTSCGGVWTRACC